MAPRFMFIPRHFHPSFETQTAAWLLQLQTRRIHFIPAECFREVRGIFCWQSTSSWQASWAFWVTHHLAFWQKDRGKLLLNDKKVMTAVSQLLMHKPQLFQESPSTLSCQMFSNVECLHQLVSKSSYSVLSSAFTKNLF